MVKKKKRKFTMVEKYCDFCDKVSIKLFPYFGCKICKECFEKMEKLND